MDRLDSVDVVISADESFPDGILDEFVQSLEEAQLRLASERRPTTIVAGIDWFLPTLVVVFLSRKLFDAFMAEAGKDLYKVVKGAVLRLAARTSGSDAEVQVTYVVSHSTPKKVSGNVPPVLSVYAILNSGSRVKFTFTPGLNTELHEAAVEEMLALLKQHYMDPDSVADLGISLEGAMVRWSTLPLIFDGGTRRWRALTVSDVRRDI